MGERAVVATQTSFELGRLRCGKNLVLQLARPARRIVGMKDERGIGQHESPCRLEFPARAIRLFPRDARVVMPALIEIIDGAVRAKAPRLGGNRIEDRSQAIFRVLDLGERFLESRLSPFSIDAGTIPFQPGLTVRFGARFRASHALPAAAPPPEPSFKTLITTNVSHRAAVCQGLRVEHLMDERDGNQSPAHGRKAAANPKPPSRPLTYGHSK